MNHRLGILLSGRGSNFAAIADEIDAGDLDAEITLVLSNREDAGGLAIAQKRGIPCRYISAANLTRPEYDRLLMADLKAARVDYVCLAGYLRLLSPSFVQAFPGRVLNIHPSLLPAFPGLDAQAQAFTHGVKISGCTVHLVNEQLDSGPIILQAAVPVEDNDTIETLSARILAEEHRLYSRALRFLFSGQYRVEGRRLLRTDLPLES